MCMFIETPKSTAIEEQQKATIHQRGLDKITAALVSRNFSMFQIVKILFETWSI
jgi:arginine repressor